MDGQLAAGAAMVGSGVESKSANQRANTAMVMPDTASKQSTAETIGCFTIRPRNKQFDDFISCFGLRCVE